MSQRDRHRSSAAARGRGFKPCRVHFPRIVWNNVGVAEDGGELCVEIVRTMGLRGSGPVYDCDGAEPVWQVSHSALLQILFSSLLLHHLAIMGMSYRRYLSGERIYGCSTCRTHLATIHSMMSRVRPCPSSCMIRPTLGQAFNGQHGRAYLFDGVYADRPRSFISVLINCSQCQCRRGRA